jgi:hypothetical protein
MSERGAGGGHHAAHLPTRRLIARSRRARILSSNARYQNWNGVTETATPPIVALVGLFGMVPGQQGVDIAKRYLAPTARTSIQRDVGGAQGSSQPD